MNLDKNILFAVRNEGYESLTPTQTQTTPFTLEGHDITASAQTGSDKITTFLLPALQRPIRHSEEPDKGPRVLVSTPAHELAAQVERNMLAHAKGMRWFHTISVVGGASFGYQIHALDKSVDLIITMPSRLMNLMQGDGVDFDRLEALILDEADRMLDIGFINDIGIIVETTPNDRQILLFSTTWNDAVGKLVCKLTKNSEIIEIGRVDDQSKIEEQLLYYDGIRHKNRLFDHILHDANVDQYVVFTSTKAIIEVITDDLYEKGLAINCLHGGMPQSWRNRMLVGLRKGRCEILATTDIAVRDIDVPTITYVINCDPPKQAEDYVHRIGCTGWVGRTDIAITFIEMNKYAKVHKIEKYIDRKLTKLTAEGTEPAHRRRSAGGKPGDKGGQGNGKKTGFKAKGDGLKKGDGGFKAKCKSGDESGDRDGSGKVPRPAERQSAFGQTLFPFRQTMFNRPVW